MKPLLRTVLMVDAVLALAFALLVIAMPWAAEHVGGLQAAVMQPALNGQLFFVTLLALAWLRLLAALKGTLTLPVAHLVGHLNWVSALVLLIWLMAFHLPALTGSAAVGGVILGVVWLVLGLGELRLTAAVRRRERLLAAGAASAGRASEGAARAREERHAAASARAPEASDTLAGVPDKGSGVPVSTDVARAYEAQSTRPTLDPRLSANALDPNAPDVNPPGAVDADRLPPSDTHASR